MSDRPRVYRCHGVILRRRNLGEADSIFTIYAEPLGKFDAIAKGIRKVRSKMRGHIEPLVYADLLVARGRSLDVLTQAQTIEPFLGVREDLSQGAAAMYCAELVDRMIADHGIQEGILDMLVAVLRALDAGAGPQVVRQFELEMLAASGYELQLDICNICGSRLLEEETLFSAMAGGLVCRLCRGRAGQGRIISVRTIKFLRYSRFAAPSQIANLRMDEVILAEAEGALTSMMRTVLDRDPSTRAYVEDIAALERRYAPTLRPDDVR